MYKNHETDDKYFSLHDCRAEHMNFTEGILSFDFPDGFWVIPGHEKNTSEETVRTDASQVDFAIIDKDIYCIKIYLFKKKRKGAVIRKEWDLKDFMKAVNSEEAVYRWNDLRHDCTW